MPARALYRHLKRMRVCTECGLRPATEGVRCIDCKIQNRERTGGRVPTASATYWGARENRWRHQHIQVGNRDFSAADYIAAFLRQDGICPLCEKLLPVQRVHNGAGTGRGISVDHDHHNHQFRALVDTACNIRIGNLSVAWAERVIAYLRRHETVMG